MGYGFNFKAFLKSYLPPMSEIVVLDEETNELAICLFDMDGDGIDEIIIGYRWDGENYTKVLKNQCNLWYEVRNINGLRYGLTSSKVPNFISRQDDTLEKTKINLVYLYPASIKEVGGTKWGYINESGKFIILPKYNYANSFQSNGLAIVEENNKYGVINKLNKYIVEPKYNAIENFSEGIAVAVDDTGAKLLNEQGKEITSKAYSYIITFKNGRAVFGDKDFKYGYLDREGREVIPAKYMYASDFKDEKAVVKISENEYALINPNGRILNIYNYPYVGNLGDGLLAFKQESGGKYGFINENGSLAIPPKYTSTEAFSNGINVVDISEDYGNLYGVIDKKGNFIIDPKYNSINRLGESRIAVGIPIDNTRPYIGSKYAIYDTSQNKLTDFIYYGVSEYEGELASACDGNYTFFIDKTGKQSQKLPKVRGTGTLSFEGNLIKAYVDQRVSYLDKSGNIVWRQNSVIPLSNIYGVKEEKFSPNRNYLVYYPEVYGIKDKNLEKNVNDKLKDLSEVKNIGNEQLDYDYLGDFDVSFFKKYLLVLKLVGYKYYFGAAHGIPTQIYAHIDLNSSKFYVLKDLFKENSNYVKILSDIIEYQIKTNPEYSYVWIDQYKGIKEDQPFYVTAEDLYIYFYPYEIAPYAAGFPTFKIPFKEIMNIIDTKGAFWMSFN